MEAVKKQLTGMMVRVNINRIKDGNPYTRWKFFYDQGNAHTFYSREVQMYARDSEGLKVPPSPKIPVPIGDGQLLASLTEASWKSTVFP